MRQKQRCGKIFVFFLYIYSVATCATLSLSRFYAFLLIWVFFFFFLLVSVFIKARRLLIGESACFMGFSHPSRQGLFGIFIL